LGLINKWLGNVKKGHAKQTVELSNISAKTRKFNSLVELNVEGQVKNLSKTTFVQRTWSEINLVPLHAWVFDMKMGIIEAIINIEAHSKIDEIFRCEF